MQVKICLLTPRIFSMMMLPSIFSNNSQLKYLLRHPQGNQRRKSHKKMRILVNYHRDKRVTLLKVKINFLPLWQPGSKQSRQPSKTKDKKSVIKIQH